MVPGSQVKLERTWSGMWWFRANSTERRARTLPPGGGHLEHLLEGDPRDPVRRRHDTRVGGEDPRDVGVDLAHVRLEGSGERDGCRVRAAPAEGGHVPLARDALEPGHDRDDALGERLAEPVSPHLQDASLGVGGVGDDARLAARERGGRHAELGERHAQKGHRDPLARGKQHVELTARPHTAHVLGEADEPVGGLAHGAYDDNHVLAAAARAGDVVRHGPDTVGVADRRAAELLHNEGHAANLVPGRSAGRLGAFGQKGPVALAPFAFSVGAPELTLPGARGVGEGSKNRSGKGRMHVALRFR